MALMGGAQGKQQKRASRLQAASGMFKERVHGGQSQLNQREFMQLTKSLSMATESADAVTHPPVRCTAIAHPLQV